MTGFAGKWLLNFSTFVTVFVLTLKVRGLLGFLHLFVMLIRLQLQINKVVKPTKREVRTALGANIVMKGTSKLSPRKPYRKDSSMPKNAHANANANANVNANAKCNAIDLRCPFRQDRS